jgi:hypothetical protein
MKLIDSDDLEIWHRIRRGFVFDACVSGMDGTHG